MPQIFHRRTNTISRVSLVVLFFAVIGSLVAIWAIDSSPFSTDVGIIQEQPVPFSHAHHVGDIGLDCRYCHKSVEVSPVAGVPGASVCMHCHTQIWPTSPMLAPIRDSYKNNTPVEWTRVHAVPDFAYFNHSIHIKKGVGCETCHGRVDQMPLMYKHASLQMEWCLGCHRSPEKFVRPRSEVFHMGWELPEGTTQHQLGKELVTEYDIHSRTDCYTCHR